MSKSNKTIYNTDNYHKKFQKTNEEYCLKYTDLICEFLLYTCENVYIHKKNYFYYILSKGIETIQHIFINLLLFTKNLELTYHHCQKGFFYYVEFIGQIGDDNHAYLKLSSKDAILFVYKKTIFDINNDFRKKYELEDEDKDFINNIKLSTNIINTITYYILKNEKICNKNKESVIQFTLKSCNTIMNKIIKINNEKLVIFERFLEKIVTYEIPSLQFTTCLETFINKLKKKDIENKSLEQKVSHNEFYIRLTTHSPLKVINWLFT